MISRRGALLGASVAFFAPSLAASAAFAAIVPFRHAASEDALADLKRRLRGARWPEGAITSDWSQGVPPQKMAVRIDRWANRYDWRNIESRLNAFAQFRTHGIEASSS